MNKLLTALLTLAMFLPLVNTANAEIDPGDLTAVSVTELDFVDDEARRQSLVGDDFEAVFDAFFLSPKGRVTAVVTIFDADGDPVIGGVGVPAKGKVKIKVKGKVDDTGAFDDVAAKGKFAIKAKTKGIKMTAKGKTGKEAIADLAELEDLTFATKVTIKVKGIGKAKYSANLAALVLGDVDITLSVGALKLKKRSITVYGAATFEDANGVLSSGPYKLKMKIKKNGLGKVTFTAKTPDGYKVKIKALVDLDDVLVRRMEEDVDLEDLEVSDILDEVVATNWTASGPGVAVKLKVAKEAKKDFLDFFGGDDFDDLDDEF